MQIIYTDVYSKMLGDLRSGEYDIIRNSANYSVVHYIRLMRLLYDRYVKEAAILEVEYTFSDNYLSGLGLYDWLIERGYGKDTSKSVANIYMLDYQIKSGERKTDMSDNWLKNESTYKERFYAAGVESINYYKTAMNIMPVKPEQIHYEMIEIEDKFDDYGIDEVDESIEISELVVDESVYDLPPAVASYIFEKFTVQASMRLSYADHTKKGRHLEVFGTFWALDYHKDEAIEKAITLINDYAMLKGYGALSESSNGWVYNGVTEGLEFYEVYSFEAAMNYQSEAVVHVDDIDFSRPERFRDSVALSGLWWADENFDNARKIFIAYTE